MLAMHAGRRRAPRHKDHRNIWGTDMYHAHGRPIDLSDDDSLSHNSCHSAPVAVQHVPATGYDVIDLTISERPERLIRSCSPTMRLSPPRFRPGGYRSGGSQQSLDEMRSMSMSPVGNSYDNMGSIGSLGTAGVGIDDYERPFAYGSASDGDRDRSPRQLWDGSQPQSQSPIGRGQPYITLSSGSQPSERSAPLSGVDNQSPTDQSPFRSGYNQPKPNPKPQAQSRSRSLSGFAGHDQHREESPPRVSNGGKKQNSRRSRGVSMGVPRKRIHKSLFNPHLQRNVSDGVGREMVGRATQSDGRASPPPAMAGHRRGDLFREVFRSDSETSGEPQYSEGTSNDDRDVRDDAMAVDAERNRAASSSPRGGVGAKQNAMTGAQRRRLKRQQADQQLAEQEPEVWANLQQTRAALMPYGWDKYALFSLQIEISKFNSCDAQQTAKACLFCSFSNRTQLCSTVTSMSVQRTYRRKELHPIGAALDPTAFESQPPAALPMHLQASARQGAQATPRRYQGDVSNSDDDDFDLNANPNSRPSVSVNTQSSEPPHASQPLKTSHCPRDTQPPQAQANYPPQTSESLHPTPSREPTPVSTGSVMQSHQAPADNPQPDLQPESRLHLNNANDIAMTSTEALLPAAGPSPSPSASLQPAPDESTAQADASTQQQQAHASQSAQQDSIDTDPLSFNNALELDLRPSGPTTAAGDDPDESLKGAAGPGIDAIDLRQSPQIHRINPRVDAIAANQLRQSPAGLVIDATCLDPPRGNPPNDAHPLDDATDMDMYTEQHTPEQASSDLHASHKSQSQSQSLSISSGDDVAAQHSLQGVTSQTQAQGAAQQSAASQDLQQTGAIPRGMPLESRVPASQTIRGERTAVNSRSISSAVRLSSSAIPASKTIEGAIAAVAAESTAVNSGSMHNQASMPGTLMQAAVSNRAQGSNQDHQVASTAHDRDTGTDKMQLAYKLTIPTVPQNVPQNEACTSPQHEAQRMSAGAGAPAAQNSDDSLARGARYSRPLSNPASVAGTPVKENSGESAGVLEGEQPQPQLQPEQAEQAGTLTRGAMNVSTPVSLPAGAAAAAERMETPEWLRDDIEDADVSTPRVALAGAAAAAGGASEFGERGGIGYDGYESGAVAQQGQAPGDGYVSDAFAVAHQGQASASASAAARSPSRNKKVNKELARLALFHWDKLVDEHPVGVVIPHPSQCRHWCLQHDCASELHFILQMLLFLFRLPLALQPVRYSCSCTSFAFQLVKKLISTSTLMLKLSLLRRLTSWCCYAGKQLAGIAEVGEGKRTRRRSTRSEKKQKQRPKSASTPRPPPDEDA
jgi:hypothetical protein